MAKRKKRLEKSIDSLEEQIILHEEKRRKAIEEGKLELADYYAKEISSQEKVKAKKKFLLDKQ